LLTQNPQIKCGFAGLLGNLFWLIARVPKVKGRFVPLASQGGLFRLTTEVFKVKSGFAPLALQADGRVTFVLETKVTKNS